MEAQVVDRQGWLNTTCDVCGKQYHLKPYLVKRSKHHYCSVECHRKGKMEYFKGEGNHQYGLKGELNSTWKGGTRISSCGYRLIQCHDHPFSWKKSGYVFEHRLVAEKYLLTDENSVTINGKRYLSPEFVVHHKNEDKLDNRVENLEVMRDTEHNELHGIDKARRQTHDAAGRFSRGQEETKK